MRLRGRLIIGLMSGTSHDGADAALVHFPGPDPIKQRPRLLAHLHTPYPAPLRRAIAAAFPGGHSTSDRTAHICSLNFTLAEALAKAAVRCARKAGLPMEAVSAIASHGQTICHIPPAGRRMGSTLQIGSPGVLAARTGRPVVSDFRPADMALGGQGAPLVPYADYVLFRPKKGWRALHNLGGISNVTLLGPRMEDVRAFDTGPGNALMDDLARALFNLDCDKGGRIAASGSVDARLLRELLSHPYIHRKPPKSTGRETFGQAMLQGLLTRQMKPADLMATLTAFTAESIALNYRRFLLPGRKLTDAVFAGGGTSNRTLMRMIAEALAPLPVLTMESAFSVPSEAREAMAFAVLGNECIEGRPASLPAVTGASRPSVLGSITIP